eukprot:GHVH01000243.1.p1 GENE.GHVH01000243.1~~GHVH01000243.1.p1  ORF type:complete len:233 (+),score=41.40 GHVH01000243.1:27-725(+)
MPAVNISSGGALKDLANGLGYSCYFHVSNDDTSKMLTDMIEDLEQDCKSISFGVGRDDSGDVSKAAAEYEIATIPTVVLFKGGTELARVSGPQFPLIVRMVQDAENGRYKSKKSDIEQRCYQIVNSAPIVVLMKGAKENPFCGFSKTLVKMLNDYNIDFDGFDIFTDEDVREAIKRLYNWPTYPQLYANGVLVGGLDVIKDIVAEGGADGLKDEIRAAASQGDKPWKFDDHH